MDDSLTDEEVRRVFIGGPDPRNAVLCLIGGRIYVREGKCWRKLDDKTYSTVKEMTGGSA